MPIFVLSVALQGGCSAGETAGCFDPYFQRRSVDVGLPENVHRAGKVIARVT